MVPFQHSFELTDGKPIYHQCRRLPPKHNEIVMKELVMMLEVGIVTIASLAWPFPALIFSKKNGEPGFCVDYRALNERMKTDQFPLPKTHEIFDELAAGFFFTTLDLFSGYWQIRISESYKKMHFCLPLQDVPVRSYAVGLMHAPSTFQRMVDSLLGIFRLRRYTLATFSSSHVT